MASRILIVDDEPIIRSILLHHYQAKGYAVELAEHGNAALARMAVARFDIVITDLMMPEMDGFALLEHLRREYPLVRVIAITGAVNLENMLACLKVGAFAFVTKPLDDLKPLDDAVHVAAWVAQTWMDRLADLHRTSRLTPALAQAEDTDPQSRRRPDQGNPRG